MIDRKGYNSSGRDRMVMIGKGTIDQVGTRTAYDRKGYNSSGRDRNGRKK